MSAWLQNKLDSGEIVPPYKSSVSRWLDGGEQGIAPSSLPKELADEFEYCVPDADETKEQWLLKPTKLIYLGEIEAETGDVILSAAGLRAVRQAGLRTHSY